MYLVSHIKDLDYVLGRQIMGMQEHEFLVYLEKMKLRGNYGG